MENVNEPSPITREDGAVDMIAFARETTIRDQMAIYAGSVKVVAPAKVNLLLNIKDKREDGYHNCVNIMHALMLHDVLYVRSRPLDTWIEGPAIGTSAGTPELPEVRVIMVGCEGVEAPIVANEDNLVTRAVLALAKACGQGQGECIDVRVEKHIPSQAGLGGGSSDAAAALVGVAKLWGIPADDERIEQCAAQLGADVAFFLKGGCARFVGAGEVFDKQLVPAKNNVVLVKPPLGLSTAEVYREFDTDPQPVSPEADALNPDAAADVVCENNLSAPAARLMPLLGELQEWLEGQPCVSQAVLCGSGSTMCAFCDSFENAMKLSALASANGYWTRATTLANLKAAVVPQK